jgi:hypothetical protein
MKIVILVLFVLIGLSSTSCLDKSASGKLDEYYIYIDGDSGRILQISYLESEQGVEFAHKNVTVSEKVTLPFFKRVETVDFINNINYDSYLKIQTDNDSTTRAIIFDLALKLKDSPCKVFSIWYPENAQNECAYCKDLAKDSVLSYLKSINYPCYMEFKKGETSKQVRLYDWWYKDSK